MKKIFQAWMLLLAAVMPGYAYSCDICGCSSGASSLGIGSMLKNNFVGVKWGYDPFTSTHPALFQGEKERFIYESFLKSELRAKMNLGLHYKILVHIPYVSFTRTEDQIKSQGRGLGDQTFILLREIELSDDDTSKRWYRKMQVGGGIKTPFGKKTWADIGLSNPLLQPGTGSWDFPLQLNYMARTSGWGVFTETNARLNTTNKDGYRFGNMYSAFTGIMKHSKGEHFTYSGILGLQGEYRNASRLAGNIQNYTSASALYVAPVLDLVYRNIHVNTGCFIPLAQNISDGYTTVKSRYFLSFHYLFNFKS